MGRPNVAFLVLDSLRRDRVSVYNSDIDFTGNLEEFSRDATVFREAVANAPWTLASHASIFTGMYPWEHGATHRNLSLDADRETLAEVFKSEGYRTGCFTVNGFISGDFGLDQGFETVDSLGGGFSGLLTRFRRRMDGWLSKPGNERLKRAVVYLPNKIFHYRSGGSQTPELLQRVRDFIGDGEESFFVFANLMDPHEPYFPPEKYRERHGAPAPRDVCQDPTDYHAGRKEVDFEAVSRIYDASVDYMDDLLGEFFDHLKERGLWEDTVVVVTADHGQMLGENGEYGHQYSVAEPLVNVPLIVKGAGEEDVEDQVELRELYDLVLSIAGIEDGYDPGTVYAKGGYDFPDLQRPRIPAGRWKEFYRRHRFVRTVNGKAVRSETGEGEVETQWQEFGELDGETRSRMEEELESIHYPDEEGAGMEEKSGEIQRKLKDLGYG